MFDAATLKIELARLASVIVRVQIDVRRSGTSARPAGGLHPHMSAPNRDRREVRGDDPLRRGQNPHEGFLRSLRHRARLPARSVRCRRGGAWDPGAPPAAFSDRHARRPDLGLRDGHARTRFGPASSVACRPRLSRPLFEAAGRAASLPRSCHLRSRHSRGRPGTLDPRAWRLAGGLSLGGAPNCWHRRS